MYGELTFSEKELLYEVHNVNLVHIHVIGQEKARIFDQFSLVIDHWHLALTLALAIAIAQSLLFLPMIYD